MNLHENYEQKSLKYKQTLRAHGVAYDEWLRHPDEKTELRYRQMELALRQAREEELFAFEAMRSAAWDQCQGVYR